MFLFFAVAESYAITQQEAEDAVDSVFYRHFHCHYMKDVIFFDGSVFRVAFAAARSGPVGSGGCGFTLINNSIGVTFDLQTDSAGAYDEGMSIMKIEPAQYPSIDSARNAIESFVYESITGTATIRNPEKSRARFQVYPNPARQSVCFSGEQGDEIRVYNILGQKLFSGRISGHGSIRWDLNGIAAGQYLYEIRRQGKRYTGQLVRMK